MSTARTNKNTTKALPVATGATFGKPGKQCIVTPDLIGPVQNGGIGTHCHHFARQLVRAGHEVTIIFTSIVEVETIEHWKSHYAALGITLLAVDDLAEVPFSLQTDWFVERSYWIFQSLKTMDFDQIHFQDWHANGFHCIQAKRLSNAFENTTLTVTMHSSMEWIFEGMRAWLNWPVPDGKQQWCERYACAHCDVLISPSQHMIDWTTARGWELSPNLKLHRYCYAPDARMAELNTPDPGVLAFFGRLETRKGIELLMSALALVSPEDRANIRKLMIVGKPGQVSSGDAEAFVRKSLADLGIPHELHTDLDSRSAIDLLRREKAVAIIPSLVDNYPFTVLECGMTGIPLVAARTGGITEQLEDSQLFNATPRAMADALARVLRQDIAWQPVRYDPDQAAADWLALAAAPVPSPQRTWDVIAADVAKRNPLVSICVPYFNYGKYIDALISSLQRSTYTNFEVNIVDDGSTDPESARKFDKLKASLADKRFSFHRKSNGGVGETRNFAASKAQGDYLIFMDADNCATPTMIERFLCGIEKSGCDVVTCHFKAFPVSVLLPDDDLVPVYGYAPIGPALEIGWLENVFGDANFIIKRKAFEAVKGFRTERHTSWEDWDILARLSLQGFKQDVLPEMLFWYRHTPEGFSRNTNLFENHRRVLQAYVDSSPRYMNWLFRGVATSYHHRFGHMHAEASRYGGMNHETHQQLLAERAAASHRDAQAQQRISQLETALSQHSGQHQPPAVVAMPLTFGLRVGHKIDGLLNRALPQDSGIRLAISKTVGSARRRP